MFYLYFKAFHIIGIIVWFAGLFYLGRLFVYHQEANQQSEPIRTAMKLQFSQMERRLYYGITWPGLCISIVFGQALILEIGFQNWLHPKLVLVVILVVYHLWCGRLRKKLLKGECNWSENHFRYFNEIPTLLMVSIVFVVVFKNEFSWSIFLVILSSLIVLISGTLHFLAKRRKNGITKI